MLPTLSWLFGVSGSLIFLLHTNSGTVQYPDGKHRTSPWAELQQYPHGHWRAHSLVHWPSTGTRFRGNSHRLQWAKKFIMPCALAWKGNSLMWTKCSEDIVPKSIASGRNQEQEGNRRGGSEAGRVKRREGRKERWRDSGKRVTPR